MDCLHSRAPTAGRIIRFQRVGVVIEGLVLQALPDGQIHHRVDAELRQIVRRADAGPQQDRRAPVRTAGEDDLARGDLGAACRDDADRTSPVEQDAIDEHVTGDLEVGAVADLLGEIDEAGVLPDAVDDVDRVPADAARVGPVEVRDHLEPLRRCRVDESALRRRQVLVGEGADWKRAGPSVVGVVAVRRVLHLLVGGHDLVDRPVIEAVRLPVADVARPCAHRDRGVVSRAAAEHLGASGIDLRGGSSTASGEAPFVLGLGRHVRGVQQIVWITADAVGGACLEQ
jgi:hypothetical protein